MVFEKPAGSEGPEVYIGEDVTGRYVIKGEELKQCNDITPKGQFPTFGDNFVPVLALDRHGDPFDGVRFICCYHDIQLQLAELEVEQGMRVHIRMEGKDHDDRWQAEVNIL
jgi:hypothetical protein